MEIKRYFVLTLSWVMINTIQLRGSTADSNETELDKFIADYINEVERTTLIKSYAGHTLNKRSLKMDIYHLKGVDLFRGFQEQFSLPAKFPNDLILFDHCSSEGKQQALYASALEANRNLPNISPANDLILYKYRDGVWVEADRVEVVQGVRLAAKQIGDVCYIILVEYSGVKGRGSPVVYYVNSESDTLQFLQMLDNHFASDVIVWKWEDMEAFIAVAVSESVTGNEKHYNTMSPIYHWEGGSHWNMVGALPTYNPRAITQFTISSSMYIAVANFQNDLGETTVSSDIFRFDLPTNKITLYQKLPTEAAVDIKYFCYQGSRTTDRFLVYASAFHRDEEGKTDYRAGVSVIYKMSDEGYFVPFQPLRVPHITSWHPIRHVKNNQEGLTLMAVTNEGIINFQYDGWRFVVTGLAYDRASFGPGPKNINVFYFHDETFISVANKENPGYGTNVFRPVLRHDVSLEQIRQQFEVWEQQFSRQLASTGAKTSSLLQTAQRAPSIHDSVINLGSKVIFENAEIGNIETYKTNVGDRDRDKEINHQLLELSSRLELVQREMKNIKSILDKISLHTLTLYKDIVVQNANIKCVAACYAENLNVTNVNGINFEEFLSQTVNIKDSVVFEEEVSFSNLALTQPLKAKNINGHNRDTLIDWSAPVHLPHGLQVVGDIIVENDLSLEGHLDGVAINLVSKIKNGDNETVLTSPTKAIDTLTVSQLILKDQTISGVDFEHFHKSTLKTNGDQIFTEFQDFDVVEADEVIAKKGVFRAGDTNFKQFNSDCDGDKSCEDNEDLSHENLLRSVSDDIEAISYINNEITITRDFTVYGTLIIVNGSLVAHDVADLKHNVSTNKVMELGITLDLPVINNHFTFHNKFQANNITVDTVNGVNLSSVADISFPGPVLVTGGKKFMGGLSVQGGLNVTGTINGVTISQFATQSPKALDEVHFDNLTLSSVASSHVEVGGGDWQHVLRQSVDGVVFIDDLSVEGSAVVNNLHVQGTINGINLESLLEDTVYRTDESSVLLGKKHFSNILNISKLDLGKLNGFDVSHLTLETFWRKHLSQAREIRVERLRYNGYLDGIAGVEFGQWMLTEGDQIIMGSQTIESLSAAAANITTINSIDIKRLMAEAVHISDNATIDEAIFQNNVECSAVKVRYLQGLKVPEDLLLSNSYITQHVSGHKRINNNAIVHGDLRPFSLSGFCEALMSNSANIVITGNANFKKEPNVSISVNNVTWTELMENTWIKEENVAIENITFLQASNINNLTVENVNNNNVKETLSMLVSLSRDQIINGTFFFNATTFSQGLEVEEVRVGGKVQGLHLQSFVTNVLLDGEDQEISGYLDFDHLIVDGVLITEGLVNSLNLSKDVMLNNVVNNTLRSTLTLTSMATKSLTIPPGSLVAGSDLMFWNKTVLKRSGPGVITGDVTFLGQFDSASDISVGGLVNSLKFDKTHLMLFGRTQTVTGIKTFSPQSRLTIDSLSVEGYLNSINLTDFYSHLVTQFGNITMYGEKRFTMPMYSKRVILPEVFQGYNLTLMDSQLSFQLPWKEYWRQMAALNDTRLLAECSLKGRANYLTNFYRVQDIKGLFVFPLKSLNSTRLGIISYNSNKTTLSLLLWNSDEHFFYEKPGSLVHVLKQIPLNVQTLTLPDSQVVAYVTRSLANTSVIYGETLRLREGRIYPTMVIDGGSRFLSFQYNTTRSCFIVVADVCRVYCPLGETRRLRLSHFSCHNLTEMSVLATPGAVYLVGLQADSLIVWRLQGRRFVVVANESQFHPVSVAASLVDGSFYVAVANRHRVGLTRSETIDMYRLDEVTCELTLEQQLPSISPQQMIFAELPSRESVLYVTSDNPATPLEVFIYRGVLGYVSFLVERTLPRPTVISAFTDHQGRHFLFVYSQGKSHVLQAQFQGQSEFNGL